MQANVRAINMLDNAVKRQGELENQLRTLQDAMAAVNLSSAFEDEVIGWMVTALPSPQFTGHALAEVLARISVHRSCSGGRFRELLCRLGLSQEDEARMEARVEWIIERRRYNRSRVR